MCPGATPDILAHSAGPLHAAILAGTLDKKWQFVGDAAFPSNYIAHPAAILRPFTRADLRDAETRKMFDDFNFYLSQLRIVIECCFGMIVNKFRILSRPLETTRLGRAILTFQACCALHNFIIDCRLVNAEATATSTVTPRGYRLVQQPEAGVEVDFVEIPTVLPDCETVRSAEGFATSANSTSYVPQDRADPASPTRAEMVDRVSRSGYIRPRTYGITHVPYLFY